MYLGSVRFFKHLILSVIALLIIVPTVGCIYLTVQNQALKSLNLEQIAEIQASAADAEQGSQDRDIPAAVYASDLTPDEPEANTIHYQLLYPQLYVENDFQYITETENTVYLTFDDGPTALTPHVLNILRDHDVRATFFVVYRDSEMAREMYNRIVDEGHTLAIHSTTHNYRTIYQSVDAFLDDFAILSDMLEEVTGVKPEIFRFPGGSFNNHNKEIQHELSAEMLRRGYTYYDWDVSSGSSTNTATASSIYSNVMRGISGKKQATVLMHDAGTAATVTTLPEIISSLKASGYKFEVLSKKIRPACFDYKN